MIDYSKRCSECGSKNIYLSRKRGLENILSYVSPLALYRCRDCWLRFWAFTNPLQSLASKIIAGSIVLLVVLPFAFSHTQKDAGPDDRSIIGKTVDGPFAGMREEKTVAAKIDTSELSAAAEKETIQEADKPPQKAVFPITHVGKEYGKTFFKTEKTYRSLKGIKPLSSNGGFKVALLADGPIREYESFFMGSPPRFAIDLLGKWKSMKNKPLKVNNPKVKMIRVGKHHDRLRVVLDLKGRIPLSPNIKDSPDGLILSIK